MRDLRERFADLDLLDTPELRSDVDARIAESGEPIPVDVLVGRLEAQLTADGTAPDTVTTSEQDMPDGTTVSDELSPRRRRSRWRGPLTAVSAAAAVIAVFVASTLLIRGSDSLDMADEITPTTMLEEAVVATTVTTTVPEPAAIFDMETDKLSDWFSGDDMNEIVAVAQRRAGTGFTLAEFTDEPIPSFDDWCDGEGPDPECYWEYPDRVHTWQTLGWWKSTVPGMSLSFTINVPRFVHLSERRRGQFVGHELLDDTVRYLLIRYSGEMWGAPGLTFYVLVDGHDEPLSYSLDVNDEVIPYTPEYERLSLAIANELLRRMNWIGTGS